MRVEIKRVREDRARPEEVEYMGVAVGLQPVWLELRSAMRGVLEETTLADVVARAPLAPGPTESPGAR